MIPKGFHLGQHWRDPHGMVWEIAWMDETRGVGLRPVPVEQVKKFDTLELGWQLLYPEAYTEEAQQHWFALCGEAGPNPVALAAAADKHRAWLVEHKERLLQAAGGGDGR